MDNQSKKIYRLRVTDYLYFETEEQMQGFVNLFQVDEFEAEEIWYDEPSQN